MTISTTQQALARVNAAGHKRSGDSTSQPTAACKPDVCEQRATRQIINRILGSLPRTTTFAFLGRAKGASLELWEYGPCPALVFRLLLDIHAEWDSQPESFTPASGNLLEHDEIMDASRAHTANCVKELKRVEGLSFAIAVRTDRDPDCHYAEWGYSIEQAFDEFTGRMRDLVDDRLSHI